MLKSFEEISSTKKRLTIEIPAEAVEAEIQKGLLEARRKANLPGFRAGKAPMTIIEKRYGKSIESEALERIVPDYYMQAVKEADIKPVSRPEMEDTLDFKRNTSLSMTFMVEVRPKIENLEYADIPVKDVPVEITATEIDDIIKGIAEEKGTYEASEEAVDGGDLITVDYTTADGVEVKDAVIKVGSGQYPKEFFEALIGKKQGDEVSVETAFPEDSPTQFAGKTPKFAITVKDVKRRNVPAVDDELAKDIGMDDLQALKDRVKEDLLSSKTAEADRKKQIEIIEKLLSTHEFEAPESMVNADLERMLGEIRASGKLAGTDEELSAEYRPKAEKSARVSILLDIIGEREGITVSEDELKEEILNFAKRYYISPENVIKYYVARDGSLDGVKNTIYEKKAMKALLDKAKIGKE